MSSKKSAVAKRLERGYYKSYSVDIDSGELSIPLLQKLTAGFENSIRRLPNCYVFRFKLRVPKAYQQDANKKLNKWFYYLSKKISVSEAINMIWAKDMSDDGSVFYHIALFFRAPECATEQGALNAKAFFTKTIKATWPHILFISDSNADSLCSFTTANIIPLNPSKKSYNQDARYCFFILSKLARKSRYPTNNLDDVFGIKYSRNPNKRRNRS